MDNDNVVLRNEDCIATKELDDNSKSDLGVDTAEFLRKEQINDPSLIDSWKFAKRGKGGFIVEDSLPESDHVEKIESVGEKCCQLCLPSVRRKSVLELAHYTVGCHQS
jgi:hypothetical protein